MVSIAKPAAKPCCNHKAVTITVKNLPFQTAGYQARDTLHHIQTCSFLTHSQDLVKHESDVWCCTQAQPAAMVNNMTFVPTAQAPTPSRAQLITAATLPPQAASEPAFPPPTIQEAAAATANAANQVLEASTLVQQ